MADKDFKVKTGLDLPAPLPVVEGGTGQTSVENTRNALMPVQTGHSGKFITTDGTGMSWAVAPQQTATDGAAGYKVYAGNTTPTGQSTGDIWIDGSTGNGIQLVRWRKTIASSGSTLTGLDDNNLTLSYTAGNEQVYINGTLITRGQDYTATNGTSVVLVQAAEVGDTVEIFGNPLFSVTDVYTQSQANSLYVRNSNYPVAGKNKVINGDFGIWQRGTSFSSIANGSYSADRWVLAANKTTTITQQAFTPGAAPVAGYEGQYFLRAAWSADGTYAAIATRLEDCRLFAGQTVTLSYWAKSNINVTNNSGWSQYFGSGGSSQISGYADNVTITTAWQRFTYTFTVPSISGKTIGSSNYFIVQPILIQTSSAYTIDVWGVQLESGSVATSFSTNTANPQAELAACQRYYVRWDTVNEQVGFYWGNGSVFNRWNWAFPVTMRSIPTVVKSGNIAAFNPTFTAQAITAIGGNYSSTRSASLDGSLAGAVGTNGQTYLAYILNTGQYVEATAEL
jgi:hypothetical protein